MTQEPLDLTAGREARNEALDHFEDHWRSAAFVEEARRTAFEHCLRAGYVTTDDLHQVFEPPASVHHNVWGAVLRPPYFVKWGEVQSKRPTAKARWIHKWVIGPAWKKYAAAVGSPPPAPAQPLPASTEAEGRVMEQTEK